MEQSSCVSRCICMMVVQWSVFLASLRKIKCRPDRQLVFLQVNNISFRFKGFLRLFMLKMTNITSFLIFSFSWAWKCLRKCICRRYSCEINQTGWTVTNIVQVWRVFGHIMFLVCLQEGRATVNQDTRLDNRVIDLRVSCCHSSRITKPAEHLSCYILSRKWHIHIRGLWSCLVR